MSWEAEMQLTNAINASMCPSISVTDSVVHVVWYDNRDLNEEIYYKRKTTGTIIIGTGNDLSGNSGQQISIYPNPVTDHFTITFTLEHTVKVNLEVRNEIGQVVATIINESLLQGNHQVDWNTKGMPSGIYFCHLTAGDQSSTGKIVVVR
jgi:hypothetical protein